MRPRPKSLGAEICNVFTRKWVGYIEGQCSITKLMIIVMAWVGDEIHTVPYRVEILERK